MNTAPAPSGLSTLSKALIGLVVLLVVAVIVVVVLAVTGTIRGGTSSPPAPPPPDEGLFSCAGNYLSPSSLTEQTPFSDKVKSYTFVNKALVYVPPTGTAYYLTVDPRTSDYERAVVLTATKSLEWSITTDGQIVSSKAPNRCLSFSPGSSYVTLAPTSVCTDANVSCGFVFDGYSFYSTYYLTDRAEILYWYDARESLSILGVPYSKIGTSGNCSNISVME